MLLLYVLPAINILSFHQYKAVVNSQTGHMTHESSAV